MTHSKVWKNNNQVDNHLGLDRNQASNLSYYFHLRKPETLNNKTMLQREQMNKALDFADTIDEDIPNRMNVYSSFINNCRLLGNELY